MLALLQQYGPPALTAILGVCFAATFVPWGSLPKLPSLATAPAAPEWLKVSPPNTPANPAGLLIKAGELWIAQGRGDLAKEAFDLAVKSAKGNE